MIEHGVRGGRFRRHRFGVGYSVRQVEAFLSDVESGAVTAKDVERVRFRSSMIAGGYDEREVDDALDRIAAELRAAGRAGDPEPPRPWWVRMLHPDQRWP
ncbi:MAG: hypothetical protein QOE01_3056 [Actinomycetota bacterium]|nr:hypothetical protein [Actinomycetota bacterium]